MIPSNSEYPQVINNISNFLTGSLKGLHDLTELDPRDLRTTFVGAYNGFILPKGFSLSQPVAGNFIHVGLIMFTMTYGLFAAKNYKIRQLIIVFVFTFILFAFLLKSQTHVSRLQLPHFIVWTPLISLSLFRNRLTLSPLIVLAVWILSIPWLVNNQFAPLIPQIEDHVVYQLSEGYSRYYISRPQFLSTDKSIAELITENGCLQVGYAKKVFEYPLWIILKEKGFTGTVQHIMINSNETKNLEYTDNTLCAIITHPNPKFIAGYDLYEFEKMNLFIKNSGLE
ncbi:MAG: hypothetical protein IH859_10315 [Chloroflexi bacterium]|nr:hypothetical protein [Chloroflexota bacterium]